MGPLMSSTMNRSKRYGVVENMMCIHVIGIGAIKIFRHHYAISFQATVRDRRQHRQTTRPFESNRSQHFFSWNDSLRERTSYSGTIALIVLRHWHHFVRVASLMPRFLLEAVLSRTSRFTIQLRASNACIQT